MTALILADIDDLKWRHGPGRADLIISLGDTADSLILEAAAAYQCATILAVKGNHDVATPFPEGITDLHLRTFEIGGVRFGGFNGSWKYKSRGHFLYEQAEVTNLLKDFPPVDVFVAHNSPMLHAKDDEVHTGFTAFDRYIAEKQPRLFLHGHQHVNRETTVGTTKIVGVYGHRVLDVPL